MKLTLCKVNGDIIPLYNVLQFTAYESETTFTVQTKKGLVFKTFLNVEIGSINFDYNFTG